jgi:hypothetical protein
MPTGTIYSLCDPTTGDVRYVGWSLNPSRRLNAHLLKATKGGTAPLHGWLRDLPLPPTLVTLEYAVEEADLPDRERHWIRACRAEGLHLLNTNDGGTHRVETMRRNGRKGGLTAQAMRRLAGTPPTPPSKRASARGGQRGAKATNSARVRCDECGRESTPGGLGAHQRTSGHTGRTRL